MRADSTAPFHAASAVLLTLLAGMCFFEIDSLWLFGHDGFNGATNAHAARMMLEHDTWGLLKYYYGSGPPAAHDYYTRLPYLSSYLVAALYWVTGRTDSEALARLVPIVFSVLSGFAVWAVLRRFWGRLAAFFGLLVLILCPVFTVYASMLDHEQGCFFFVVAYLGLYLSWLEVNDWRKVVGILVLATLSVQYDWTGYYIALPVALHAVGCGLRAAPNKLSWRPEYTFAMVFSAVILLNIGGFLYAMGELAGFAELRAGLSGRSRWLDGYLSLLWNDVGKMYTYPILGLGVVWLLRLLQRWASGQGRLRDFIPLVFLWAQLFRSFFFSQAGHFHIFWVYYGVGFLAFACADLFEDVVVRLPAWLQRHRSKWNARIPHALAVGLALACLGWAAMDSSTYFWLGHKTGGALRHEYHAAFNRYVGYVHKAGQLRPEGLLLVDDSAWRWWPQVRWYFGYPHLKTRRDGAPTKSRGGVQPTAVLFDVSKTRIRRWLKLMSSHPVTLVAGRLALVDLTVAKRHLRAIRPHPVEASPWYRYWTNFFMPRWRWVPDPESEAKFRTLYAKHVDE